VRDFSFPLTAINGHQDVPLRRFPMHRALCLSEVVRNVTHYLGFSEWADDNDQRQSALRALASVNRGLSEHALDRLWEKASFWELARTMESSIWAEFVVDHQEREVEMDVPSLLATRVGTKAVRGLQCMIVRMT
jgi:hypothetical protein